jgi:hypothetical protein
MSNDDVQEQIIPIYADDTEIGIQLEYDYVSSKFGAYGEGWILVKQRVKGVEQSDGSELMLDTFFIRLSDGSERAINFDITSFYGK